MERRPSEILTNFLNFLEAAEREYESAYAAVGKEDSRVQTFLHDMEFAPDGKTRNRIATRLQQSRRESVGRRIEGDANRELFFQPLSN